MWTSSVAGYGAVSQIYSKNINKIRYIRETGKLSVYLKCQEMVLYVPERRATNSEIIILESNSKVILNAVARNAKQNESYRYTNGVHVSDYDFSVEIS